eukprot:GDKJ01011908.1.p1 GENE.GDKJ01011908.1~~GDKJ01011908.1.p1  ORF type:complete len:1253 (-),score=301.09 GDKJ01011908.1:58-3816(-)
MVKVEIEYEDDIDEVRNILKATDFVFLKANQEVLNIEKQKILNVNDDSVDVYDGSIYDGHLRKQMFNYLYQQDTNKYFSPKKPVLSAVELSPTRKLLTKTEIVTPSRLQPPTQSTPLMKNVPDLFRISPSTSPSHKRDLLYTLANISPPVDGIIMNAYEESKESVPQSFIDLPPYHAEYLKMIQKKKVQAELDDPSAAGSISRSNMATSPSAVALPPLADVVNGRPRGSTMAHPGIEEALWLHGASPDKKDRLRKHFRIRLNARNALHAAGRGGECDSGDEVVLLSDSDENDENENETHTISAHDEARGLHHGSSEGKRIFIRDQGLTAAGSVGQTKETRRVHSEAKSPYRDQPNEKFEYSPLKSGKSGSSFMVAKRTPEVLSKIRSCKNLESFAVAYRSTDLPGKNFSGSTHLLSLDGGETLYGLNQAVVSDVLPGGLRRIAPSPPSFSKVQQMVMSKNLSPSHLNSTENLLNSNVFPASKSLFSYPQHPVDQSFRITQEDGFVLNRFIQDSPTRSPLLPPIKNSSPSKSAASKSPSRNELLADHSKATRDERSHFLPPYHAANNLNPFETPLEFADIMHGKYGPPLLALIKGAELLNIPPVPPRILMTVNRTTPILDLSFHGLTFENSISIAYALRAIKRPDFIKKLLLRGNEMLGDDGAYILLDVLQKHPGQPLKQLIELDLRCCGLEDLAIQKLTELFSNSELSNLRILRLGGNRHLKMKRMRDFLSMLGDVGAQFDWFDVSDCGFGKSEDLVIAGNSNPQKGGSTIIPTETAESCEGFLQVLGSSLVRFGLLKGLRLGGWDWRLIRTGGADALNCDIWSAVSGLKSVDLSAFVSNNSFDNSSHFLILLRNNFSTSIVPDVSHTCLKEVIAAEREKAAAEKAKNAGGGQKKDDIPKATVEALGAMPSPPPPQLQIIYSLIEGAQDLEEVDLSGCAGVDPLFLMALARLLASKECALRGLNLQNCGLGLFGLRLIVRMIMNDLIKNVDVAGCSTFGSETENPFIVLLAGDGILEDVDFLGLEKALKEMKEEKEGKKEEPSVSWRTKSTSFDMTNFLERNLLIELCIFLHQGFKPGWVPHRKNPYESFPVSDPKSVDLPGACQMAFWSSGKPFKLPSVGTSASSIPLKDIATMDIFIKKTLDDEMISKILKTQNSKVFENMFPREKILMTCSHTTKNIDEAPSSCSDCESKVNALLGMMLRASDDPVVVDAILSAIHREVEVESFFLDKVQRVLRKTRSRKVITKYMKID